MKKWIKFFLFSFFSHKEAKGSAKRGYTNAFLGFVLALTFLWLGFVGADMLPFGSHYENSPDFKATVYAVFANADADKRIDAEIKDGVFKVKDSNGQYAEGLLVNTFENDTDKQNYSVNGYNVVIDSRPADTLAEIEAYCVSNDGKNTVISYEDYLTLSEVARLNFDFKLRYTGNALELSDEAVKGYREYADGLSDENKSATEDLANELAQGKITEDEYNRGIYELYFINYYPEITAYESASSVPLLRNYYYHNYISEGAERYLFVFDDYMAGSFETENGIDVSFYGFYNNLENGLLVNEGDTQEKAISSVDDFIKDSFGALGIINLYVYAMNVLSFIPVIALMLIVVTLLAYSILRIRSVESITSLGGMLKIAGAFLWVSGVISAVLTVMISFFAGRDLMNILPLVLFFATLMIRTVIFTVKESKLYAKQLEEQESE